jgi:hypothetical protein
MELNNKPEFLRLLTAFAENYNKKFSEMSAEIYWNVLKTLTLAEFKKAVNHLATTRTYSTFPLPAEFINAVHPPSDLELQAASAVTELRQRLNNPYLSFRFSDPVIGEVVNLLGGWNHVWKIYYAFTDERDERFWFKDIEKLYRAQAQKPRPAESPRMIGIFEHENATRGYLTDEEGNPVYKGGRFLKAGEANTDRQLEEGEPKKPVELLKV